MYFIACAKKSNLKVRAMKVTAQLYGQFLVSSQVNYTGTYLADHLEGLTHDNVR